MPRSPAYVACAERRSPRTRRFAGSCFLSARGNRAEQRHKTWSYAWKSRARSSAQFERDFEKRHGRAVHPETAAPPAAIRKLIRRLRSGERPSLQFDLRGLSEFERAVLMKALEIPDGEVLGSERLGLLQLL